MAELELFKKIHKQYRDEQRMEMENGNGGREIQERLKAGIESYT
jgi:hypothetical protein